MNRINKHGFTLIELMVGVAIIAILGTLAFLSYTGQIGSSRDSVRLDNLAKIQLYLASYKEKHGVYPIPTQGFNITNNGKVVAIQGKLNQEFLLDSFDSVPLDPLTKLPYPYSILKNRSAYQIGTTLEDNETHTAVIVGDYSSVAVNVLPSIMLALNPGAGVDVEIDVSDPEGASNRRAFLLNNSTENLPYKLDGSAAPQVGSLGLDDLITSAEADGYWQNIDYKTCEEIKDAGKYIGDGEYQITFSNILTNTECTINTPSVVTCITDTEALNLNNSFGKNWSNLEWCNVNELDTSSLLLVGTLPDELWSLTGLTSLDISGNSLTSIPSGIGNLTNLTLLNAGGNSLTSIPSAIGNLTELEHIVLNQNNLGNLPTELSLLTELKTLDLSSNNSLGHLKHYFKHDSGPQSKTEGGMTISRDGSNVIVTGVF